MYDIMVESENNLIIVALEGFWSESDFERFIADQHAAHSQLKCPIGKHLLLCDLTKLNVSTSNVAERSAVDLNSEGPRDAQRVAIVISSALLKLQMLRLLTRANAKIFDDISSAREWLFSSEGDQTLI